MFDRQPSVEGPIRPDTPPVASLDIGPMLSPISSIKQKSSQNLSLDLMHDEPAPEAGPSGQQNVQQPPMPFAGPQPMEVVITMDTTGSMSQCLEQVQAQVGQMIERLFMDIPQLKIGVIAHGDYCDEEHFYVTRHVDLTNQLPTLCDFVKDVGGTGGGDWEECYEYVLHMARTQLSWSPDCHQRVLVMIGDAAPHAPGSEESRGYDWRQEMQRLHDELGVAIYSVQCLDEPKATPFWEELADRTQGKHLRLAQVASIVDMIMAIVYREHGGAFFNVYEQEVRQREGPAIADELEDMFDRLRVPEASTSAQPAPLMKRKSTLIIAQPKPKKMKAVKVDKEKKIVKVKKQMVKGKKQTPMKRQARENVQNSHFALNSLKWSPWKEAICLQKPDPESSTGRWVPRASKRPGFRDVSLFSSAKVRMEPAIYEVAVQTGFHKRRHTVFFRCCHSLGKRGHWDQRLFRGVQHRVTRALTSSKGKHQVTVLVRRASLPKEGVSICGQKFQGVQKVQYMLRARYDYAWRVYASRPAYRSIERDGCHF